MFLSAVSLIIDQLMTLNRQRNMSLIGKFYRHLTFLFSKQLSNKKTINSQISITIDVNSRLIPMTRLLTGLIADGA